MKDERRRMEVRVAGVDLSMIRGVTFSDICSNLTNLFSAAQPHLLPIFSLAQSHCSNQALVTTSLDHRLAHTPQMIRTIRYLATRVVNAPRINPDDIEYPAANRQLPGNTPLKLDAQWCLEGKS